jgi:hypothetical protein
VSNSGAGPRIAGVYPPHPGIERALSIGSDKVVVVDEDGRHFRATAWSPLSRMVQVTDGVGAYPEYRWLREEDLIPVGSYGDTEVWAHYNRARVTSQREKKAQAYVDGILAAHEQGRATGDEREVAQARSARQQPRRAPKFSSPVSVRPQRALGPGDGE